MTDAEARIELQPERVLRLLAEGKIEVHDLIPWSSNATLLVTVRDDEYATLAIYKPQRGERPLWDFPRGTLGRREVAAYLVAGALDWGLVPPTVLRRGPHGPGSVQLFINAREDANYFTIQREPRHGPDLQRLAAFDVITNNADRKAGHCLVDEEGRLWAIDNALCFHAEPKLRTVIWDFAGMPLPADIQADLGALGDALDRDPALAEALDMLLSVEEVAAFRGRVTDLIRAQRYPEPGPGRVVPWPLI